MATWVVEPTVANRKQWMATLACAPFAEVEKAWNELPEKPSFHFLRRPETGLIMVRARAGGQGARFNMGEMVVSRCTVRIDSGQVGCAYVMGGNHRRAELAAIFDALMQDRRRNPQIALTVIAVLAALHRQRNDHKAAAAASTKVDFYTLVRGE